MEMEMYSYWRVETNRIIEKFNFNPRSLPRILEPNAQSLVNEISSWKFQHISVSTTDCEMSSLKQVDFTILGDKVFSLDYDDNKSIFRFHLFVECMPCCYYHIWVSNKEVFYRFLDEYSRKYPQLVEGWKSKKDKWLKDKKIKKIAIPNIRVLVEGLMTEGGYAYSLSEEDYRCVLKIRMRRKQMLEMTLPYKTFTQKIDKIIPTIKLMEQATEDAGIGIRIKGYGNNVEWKNNK